MTSLSCGATGVACGVDDTDEHLPKVLPPLLTSCQHLVQKNGSIVGRDIAAELQGVYSTLASALPPSVQNTGPAYLAGIDGRLPLVHARVGPFLQELGQVLHSLQIGRGNRVALVLPNGPELALAILAVSQWAACVPLSATGAPQELAADLQRCGADLVLGPYSEGPLPTRSEESVTTTEEEGPNRNGVLSELAAKFGVMASSAARDWTVHHHVQETADELGIPFCGLVPDPETAGPFRLVMPRATPEKRKTRTATRLRISYESLAVKAVMGENDDMDENDGPEDERFAPNSGSDEALVLFTSGTTGNKKLVAHQMADLLVAATTIALSWQLQPTDVNCNLMPLFHVGGIVRQVYSPLVSGGCVICCPSFDADLFWALLQRQAFNWYYAAPTMHSIILQTGKSLNDDKILGKYYLKMIANAAGGLLPSLAEELRDTFHAAVLPSYGMTECMPISSPPASYDLSKPGTSGVPVGPEVAILNLASTDDTGYARLAPGQEGPICVRGEPCFRGYGVLANDPTAKKPETFLKDGWFNTGDLGYLDNDGYLYITGRSKEVINRGGEIISPMEVEEAVQAHPDVRACAAFAANHDVLQETVGIVIVPEPDRPRSLDLSTLHSFIADKLAQPKWPQCLVYMEGGLPKSHTNKLLRVKLGSRLGLPEFNDDMSPWERTFNAKCPVQGTPLDTAIPSSPVVIDSKRVESLLRTEMNTSLIHIVPHPSRPGALVAHVQENEVDRLKLIDLSMAKLHRYEVPTHVCFTTSSSGHEKIAPSPKDAVTSLLTSGASPGSVNDKNDPIVEQLQDMFLNLLDLDYVPAPDADFFHIGGNSMRASQLAAKIRRSFDVGCSGAEIFHHSKCCDLASLIRSRSGGPNKGGDDSTAPATNHQNRDAQGAPFDSSPLPPEHSFLGSIFQLVPMFLLFPAWQITRYLLFFLVLLEKSNIMPNETDRSFVTFVGAYMVYHLAWITFAPLVFVLVKWIVIGKYKSGRYPIWGLYYLRWWFVDVCRKLFLRGIWGSSPTTLRLYYRMLGARIAPGARISLDCDLAEYDLVTIGENAALELSTVRGFGVDNGAIMLGPVEVGDFASVGLRSVVAPHTSVPAGQHLGPGSSSYDRDAFHEKFADVNRQLFPLPSASMQLLLGFPILFFVEAASQVPSMVVLYSLLWFKSREVTNHFFYNWNELMDWLCDPARMPFFFGIRLARALFSPFCYIIMAILVKHLIVGRIQPGVRTNSEWEKFRFWLAAELFPRKKVQAVTDLIGRHYEGVSVLYRLLGAKVGRRVFWPGNQPIVNGTYDLLSIGDDAVFGSRSTLLCASAERTDRIVLCAGANVSDNCVVLPGTVVGKNAVLGSNSISRQGAYLPGGSVYFGNAGAESQCLESGDGSDAEFYQPMADESGVSKHNLDLTRLPMIGDESTIRPFGKAVYLGKAKGYMVLPIPLIVAYTWMNRIFASVFHTLPLLAAVQLGSVFLYSDDPLSQTYRFFTNSRQGQSLRDSTIDYYHAYDDDAQAVVVNHDNLFWIQRDFDNNGHHHTYWEVFAAVFTAFLVTHFVRVLLWLVIELSAKWIFMGRRKSGRYNYDTSSYAQRWELYQLTAKIRKISRLNLLQFLSGTPYMNWYFRWNGGNVGKNCCLYPSGADPFMPEPDLVTIGNGSVVDCASIVCHLNTRGNFELAPITIENSCTLRTRSRVQQGVHMEEGSMLLEKSIAMTGEVLDSNSVWQGGPSTLWFRSTDESLYAPPVLFGGAKTKDQVMAKEEIEMGPLKGPLL